MTGIEVAVGYLFAWALRKASRVSGQLDAEVNHVLDKGIDRLHNLVSGKLGENSALRKLAEEADAGQDQLSERTGDQVRLALEEAAEQDPQFAEALGGSSRSCTGWPAPLKRQPARSAAPSAVVLSTGRCCRGGTSPTCPSRSHRSPGRQSVPATMWHLGRAEP